MQHKLIHIFCFLMLALALPAAAQVGTMTGRVYATPEAGVLILEQVRTVTFSDGTMDRIPSGFVAVKNYSGADATLSKRITITARKTGIYNATGTPIEQFDCAPATQTPAAAAPGSQPMPAPAPPALAFNQLPKADQLRMITNQIAKLEAQRADIDLKLANCRKLQSQLETNAP